MAGGAPPISRAGRYKSNARSSLNNKNKVLTRNKKTPENTTTTTTTTKFTANTNNKAADTTANTNTHPELSTLKYPHTSGVERKLSSLMVPLVGCHSTIKPSNHRNTGQVTKGTIKSEQPIVHHIKGPPKHSERRKGTIEVSS